MSTSHTNNSGKALKASSRRSTEASNMQASKLAGAVSSFTAAIPIITTSVLQHSNISIPVTASTDPGIGNTFLIPSATRVKARKKAAMVTAGIAALQEVEDEEEGEEEDGEGEGEEDVAVAPVLVLAPDRRGEIQTRLLQRKLKCFQDEAEAAEERPSKRQRIMENEREALVLDEDEVIKGDTTLELDLVARVAKMEAEMAEDIQQESSEMGRWIQKRLFLNLQEKERLLKMFLEMREAEKKEAKKEAWREGRLSELGLVLAGASPE